MTSVGRPRTGLRGLPRPAVRDWYADATLAALALAAALALVVVHVVDVRRDYAQEALRLRDGIRHAEQPGPHALVQLVQALGMWWFLVVVAVVLGVSLARQGVRTRAIAVGAVTAAALVSVAVCKLLIRHPSVGSLLGLPIGSFPSGHTTDLTAVVGVVLLALLPLRWRWAAYVVAAAVGFVAGRTRVVAGLHTPDDVLTGWLLGLGLVLAAGTWLTAREPR